VKWDELHRGKGCGSNGSVCVGTYGKYSRNSRNSPRSSEVARRFKVDLNYAGLGLNALGNPSPNAAKRLPVPVESSRSRSPKWENYPYPDRGFYAPGNPVDSL